MTRGIMINDQASIDNFDLAEVDMRRFWSQRCVIWRNPSYIFIEVGAPVAVRVKMGVERLKSFGVKAHAVNH